MNRSRAWTTVAITVIVAVMVLGGLPLPNPSASPSGPSTPVAPPTIAPDVTVRAGSPAPPTTSCPTGYPAFGSLPGPGVGILPVDPNFYSQGPCPLIQQDEVHASLYSSTPGSAARWTVPWTLPAGGPVLISNLSYGFYVGMVVGGDNHSAWNQSYLEVEAEPQYGSLGRFSYAVSVAVLSFANASTFSGGGCPGGSLNLSWNDSYFCEWDDLLGGNPLTLESTAPPGATYDLTFAGRKGGSDGLDLWFNNSQNLTDHQFLQLNSTTTGTVAFEPAYSASCDGSCNLDWALPYGLGYGLSPCPASAARYPVCNTYNGTAWGGAPPIGFGIPLFWNGTGYGANYRYLAPLSSSGVCNSSPPNGVIVGNCFDYTNYGGTGFYPYNSLNATGINLGGGYPWTLDSFGGASLQYAVSAVAHDLTPFVLRSLSDSSRAGFLAPGLALNLSAVFLDLGTVRSASVTWSLAGGAWTTSALSLSDGAGTLSTWTGSIPAGPDGKLSFYVNATNLAGATLSSGLRTVLRGPIPHFQVQLLTIPTACGQIDLNGTRYSNDTNVSLLPGLYPLSAGGCYPYRFSQWQSTGPLAFNSTASPVTNVTITGNGTITAAFQFVRPTERVLILVTPSSCGLVGVNGTLNSNGTTLELLFGYSFPISQTPSCSSDSFAGWGLSGNLSVLGSTLVVDGNGSLTARYLPTASSYTLTVATTPSACGGIGLGGAGYVDGDSLALAAGSYALTPLPCANWGFSNFTVTGGLTLSGFNLTISGSGTVTEHNYELTEIHIVTVPSGCGGVVLNNQSYPGGATVVSTNGTAFEVTGFSCAQHYLEAMTASGALTLQGTLLTVNGSGTITVASQPGHPSVFVGFLTNPTGCGAIDFNGSIYADGGFVSLSPGASESIAAIPCAHYGFIGWGVSGGIQISGPTLWANSSGSVTAHFGPVVSLYINLEPAQCGAVAIAGQTYPNGSTANLIAGPAYTIATAACPHYRVIDYETSPGANVTNGSLSMTTSATLVVVLAPIPYPVSLVLAGPGCGTVGIGPSTYTTGQLIHATAGNYTLAARPCSTSLFAGWNTTGNLSVTGATLVVGGIGELVANFLPIPPQVSISGPGAGYPGVPVLLIAQVAVVQPGPYQFIWNFGDGTTNVTTSASTSHAYASAGTYTVHLEVIDPFHHIANSSSRVTIIAGGGTTFAQSIPALIVIGLTAVVVAGIFLATAWYRGRRPKKGGP